MSLHKALLQPLLQDIQSTPSTTSDPATLLRLHHLIKAVGNVAYGFPELKNTVNAPEGQWVLVFQEATRIVLASLKTHNRVAIIREAVCAFSHLLHLRLLTRVECHTVPWRFQEHCSSYRRSCSPTGWHPYRLSCAGAYFLRSGGLPALHWDAGSSIQGSYRGICFPATHR